jgi:hypothetical protein
MSERVTRSGLIGSWRLERWEARADGAFKNFPFGPQAQGFLVYADDGWMSAVLSFPKEARPPFGKPNLRLGSIEERAAAADTYVSYAGRWRLVETQRGAQVHHDVECALLPNWVGLRLVRDAAWDEVGETRRLVLSTEPETTKSGAAIVNVLIWRRAEAQPSAVQTSTIEPLKSRQ